MNPYQAIFDAIDFVALISAFWASASKAAQPLVMIFGVHVLLSMLGGGQSRTSARDEEREATRDSWEESKLRDRGYT